MAINSLGNTGLFFAQQRHTTTTEALPLEALNMASWNAGDDNTGVIHHSDRGSQYVSIRYTDRLGDFGITPSVGTVEETEIATLDWVWWYNNIG